MSLFNKKKHWLEWFGATYFVQKNCFFIFRLGLLFPATSKCLIYYLCIIFTYIPWNFFPLFVVFYPKNKKNSQFQPFFSCFRHVQDMYDLKCKNIIITDEYELQFHLTSLFNWKDIDQGNLAQLFMPKNAAFGYFFIFRLGLLFPASSKCLIYYLCIICT